VATEEALKSVPPGLREASLALGATKLKTIVKIVLPQAFARNPDRRHSGRQPARLRGSPPFSSPAWPINMSSLPTHLTDQFMDLGYDVFVLSTQSPNIDQTQPILYTTVLVLLMLTFALNIVAIFVRSKMAAARCARFITTFYAGNLPAQNPAGQHTPWRPSRRLAAGHR